MAELIGLIASIGTIASAAFTAAKTISDLADELDSAGRYVKAISTDTKAVALILHEMKRRFDRSTKITQQTFEVANEIADLCKADLDDIKLFLLQLLPAGGGNMRLAQKAKWIFVKSKISMRRSSLNSLKLTIALFLHTLDFVEGDLLNEDFTKDEIKNLVTESKNTKSDFLAAERTDQALAQVYTTALLSGLATHTDNDDGMDTMDATVQLLDYDDKSQEEGTLALKDSNDQSDDTMNLLRTAKTSQLDNQLSDFQVIESLSDDHYLYIARHIHTHKTVTSFALVVLDGRHEQEPLNRNPPSEATVQSNEPRELSTNDPQGVDPHSSECFSAYDGASRPSPADERSSQWDESESSYSSIDVERASRVSIDDHSAILVDGVNRSDQGMSHARQSGDRRPKRAGGNTRGASGSHVCPEASVH
ncbi:hypothetical protein GGR58DRAFT_443452 [Xylaria digitata]|nr:hypothetical protein GGR58DRAFT_443452 [Xylaria digitata]